MRIPKANATVRRKTRARSEPQAPQEKAERRLGPGEYRPDPTEGITRVADLPRPKISTCHRSFRQQPCPHCGQRAYRDRVFRRRLHDVGELASGRPHEIEIIYSQHYCPACQAYFTADTSDLAPPRSQYTHLVISLAVRTVVEDGLPYQPASWRLWRDHRVFVPWATIQNWVEAGGKKGARPR